MKGNLNCNLNCARIMTLLIYELTFDIVLITVNKRASQLNLKKSSGQISIYVIKSNFNIQQMWICYLLSTMHFSSSLTFLICIFSLLVVIFITDYKLRIQTIEHEILVNKTGSDFPALPQSFPAVACGFKHTSRR